MDVTNRAQCFEVISRAQQHFGKIDVVINNAGYGLFGTVEETSEQEARDQIETNVFGTLWITQAAIPVLRAQGKGHIIQVSSILGLATLPVLGLYNASKWAVEGLSETLAAEVKDFGIDITIVEPNGFSTDWGGASATHSKAINLYDNIKSSLFSSFTEDSIGDPQATSEAILQIVDAENPPLRLLLGKVGFPWISQVYAERISTWEQWQDVAVAAHGSKNVLAE